jgi:DNA-binding NarL/FixJ family response regulator
MLEIPEHARIKLRKNGLSPRETEILTCLVQGKSNIAIGECLGISPRTVSKHLEHIYSKLKATGRTSAIAALFEISHVPASSKNAVINTLKVKTNKKRVLLVDDDRAVRRVLRALLEFQGCICEEAEDGVVALEWLDTHQADLVISDCHMPGISGPSFLKQLKARCLETKNPFPPIIVLSGNLTEARKKELCQIGVYATCDKPPQFDSFLTIVAKSMEDRPSIQKSA